MHVWKAWAVLSLNQSLREGNFWREKRFYICAVGVTLVALGSSSIHYRVVTQHLEDSGQKCHWASHICSKLGMSCVG